MAGSSGANLSGSTIAADVKGVWLQGFLGLELRVVGFTVSIRVQATSHEACGEAAKQLSMNQATLHPEHYTPVPQPYT